MGRALPALAAGALTLVGGVLVSTGTAMAVPAPPPGHINTVAGAAGGGQGLVAGDPEGVAAANGKIYVADTTGGVVDLLDPSTGQTTVVAGGGSGDANGTPATSAALFAPVGVALDASGDLFISDQGDSRVEEVPAVGGTHFGIPMTAGELFTVAGSGHAGAAGDGGPGYAAQLNQPLGIAVDYNGDLFIADSGNNRVQEVSAGGGSNFGQTMAAGAIYTVAGSGVPAAPAGGGTTLPPQQPPPPQLSQPGGVAVDSFGDLLIADTPANLVLEVAANTGGNHFGQSMTAGYTYTVAGSGASVLSGPRGLSLDGSGNLFIADTGDNRVQEV
ncbi:MAG TPA: hypothetical protein VG184_07275, partial [Acidimicrobiales bacterium]|nr:hypothetical protein [Acidimicrobiales bacterium]